MLQNSYLIAENSAYGIGFEVPPKKWKEFILTFTPDVSLIGGGEEIEAFFYNK